MIESKITILTLLGLANNVASWANLQYTFKKST